MNKIHSNEEDLKLDIETINIVKIITQIINKVNSRITFS